MRFVSASYWDVRHVRAGLFEARLAGIAGRRVAQGRDFGGRGDRARTSSSTRLGHAGWPTLAGQPFTVTSVEETPYSRRPAAPFRTSTLQQEASRKLRLFLADDDALAQRLYENGYITYMRTDSVALSDAAVSAARAQAAEVYGTETVPDRPRSYARAVANAQEAHEAIRPAGDRFRTPDQVRELARDEWALYELIWKRTIASQMKDAAGSTVRIRLGAEAAGEDVEFRGRHRDHLPGFLLAYESGKDEPADEDEQRRLPPLEVGQRVEPATLEPQGHETSPPARYTEASLVKALEDRGIGRPSTYAAIMGTILDRGYVFKKGTRSYRPSSPSRSPSYSRAISSASSTTTSPRGWRRPRPIANGEQARREWLQRFYFGDGTPGLHALVTDHLDEIDARAVNSIEIPAVTSSSASVATVPTSSAARTG